MALVKCRKCGNMVSDKADTCSVCGTPTVANCDSEKKGNEKANVDTPKQDATKDVPRYFSDSSDIEELVEDENNNHKITYLIIAVVVLLIAVIALNSFNKDLKQAQDTPAPVMSGDSATVKNDTVKQPDTVVFSTEAAPPKPKKRSSRQTSKVKKRKKNNTSGNKEPGISVDNLY